MEYRSRSLRIADDVWEALQASEFSANQLLRSALGLTARIPLIELAPDGLALPDDIPKVAARLEAVRNIRPLREPLLKPKERK